MSRRFDYSGVYYLVAGTGAGVAGPETLFAGELLGAT